MGVGVDIGSRTIKILELEKSGNNFSLLGSGIVGYAGKTTEEMVDEKEMMSLAGLIKKLHKEAGISKKTVTISIPENKVFTRTVSFPMLTDPEIDSAIKWEAEQYIPIPLEEAIIQHEVIERNDKKVPPEVLVLLVAVPQALVEKYIRLLRLAGLTVEAVESELMALTRAVAVQNQTNIIIDFGAKTTDLAVARNRQLVFSRSIPIGGDAMTRAVAQGLSVELSQAEEYKKTYGFDQSLLEGKVAASLNPVIKNILDEIKKAVHYYQTEQKSDLARQVIFSGGSAGVKNLASAVTKQLGMEFIMANPFANVSVSAEAQKSIANFAPLYGAATGLAMRE